MNSAPEQQIDRRLIEDDILTERQLEEALLKQSTNGGQGRL
jgi:hypothetical protein